jgi:hypothetical protein
MLDETNEAGFFVAKGTSRLGYKAQVFMGSCANHNAVIRAVFDKSNLHYFPPQAQAASRTSSKPTILRSLGNMKNVGQVGMLLGNPYWCAYGLVIW